LLLGFNRYNGSPVIIQVIAKNKPNNEKPKFP
jgi:hypothetical protein